MAPCKVSPAAAGPVGPYREGVAKCLVDRLYGANGPEWGTQLAAIEDTIKAVRQVLSEKMLDEALQRPADTLEQRPADWQGWANGGQEVGRYPEREAWSSLPTEV